jgi:hypothetical protein
MIIKNLRHTFNSKLIQNEDEEVYVQGWQVIEDEVTRLFNESWKLQEDGRAKHALAKNYAANYHIYLFYYAYFIRNYLDRQGLIDDRCTSVDLEETFKISCVEDNLTCLSSTYGTDYVSVWKQLLDIFSISRQTEGCETSCCLGISEMTINADDECIAFIIGLCDENEEIVGEGEYEDCAYDDGHNHGEIEACAEVTENCN